MKLNDDILRSAATMLRDEKMNALPHEKECPVHTFSDEFEQEMQELIETGLDEVKKPGKKRVS